MRKINLLGLSLILGLTLSGGSAFAQSISEIGVVGPMRGQIINESGIGVSGAFISVVPVGTCFDWEGTSAKSSSFGYYFLSVHYDCTLFVTVSKKGMNFTPSSLLVSIT